MTHKPLCEVENGDDKDIINGAEKAGSELNLLKSESSKSDGASSYEHKPCSSSVAPKAYNNTPEMEASCSTNTNFTTDCSSNKDFFLDRFMSSSHQEGYATSDFMANFPLHNHHITYNSNNNNSNHFQTQTRPFDINSDFTSTILPISTTSFLPTSICYKPSLTLPSDDICTASFAMNGNGSHYWESRNSPLNLHNTNNMLSWGLADSAKEPHHQIHMMETEEAKWAEYLHSNPILMLAAVQNQTPESLCNEIKPAASHLVPDTLGAILPHNHNKQQEQPSMASSIFSNDIQKLTAAFGHI